MQHRLIFKIEWVKGSRDKCWSQIFTTAI